MISGANDKELELANARADLLSELQPEIDNLKKENQKYKEVIDKAIDLLDNYQNNLYSKKARETLDDDIEMALDILKEVE